MNKYDHKKIEKRWQEIWREEKLYETPDSIKGKDPEASRDARARNYYVLVEFAYPSGNLHVGHWYAFSVPDMYARYMRMNGHNVMYPFGFDSFGLPAENAAIKRKLNPRDWTHENIEYMRKQLDTMGTMFDWSREVTTSDPNYYKWTQWLFLQLFKKGLAYQAEALVNWCPSCKTVLANEQVRDGSCERCDTDVEKRQMKQWMFKITDYAERLLEDLNTLDWPEPIKEAQRQWIGKSEGAELEFEVKDTKERIQVFTTRPDTLFGATYMVLAPEHELISTLKDRIENWDEVENYIKQAEKKTELERQENKEKTGVELKGIKAINPGNKEEIPVWVADYVLSTVGTGAIMAVPAHDERDFEFARKLDLPIRDVVTKRVTEFLPNAKRRDVVKGLVVKKGKVLLVKEWVHKEKVYRDNIEDGWTYSLPGGGYEEGEKDSDVVVREMYEETGYDGVLVGEYLGRIEGFYHSDYHSATRVRGVSCYVVDISNAKKKEPTDEDVGEIVWLEPEEAIERLLEGINPGETHFIERWLKDSGCFFKGEGSVVHSDTFDGLVSEEAREKIAKAVGGKMKTQYRLRDWGVSRQRYWGCPIPVVHCEKCGAVSVPEKELPIELPEIEDFMPSGDGKSPLAKVESFVNTQCPKCNGEAKRETDTLDTFVDSSWYFLRYTDPHNDKVFADKKKMDQWLPVDFYSGGAEHTTMHLLYSRFFQKALYDIGLVQDDEPYKRRMNRGIILGPDGNKMSKSKGNVIDPDDVVDSHGADTVRMYLAFIGPYNEVGHYPWSPESIAGVRRFLDRIWRLSSKLQSEQSEKTEQELHRAIQKVGNEIDGLKMNTAVAALMSFLNVAEKEGITEDQFETLVKLLAPLAPHVSEELWRVRLGHGDSVHLESWPEYDGALLEDDQITIVVQVNGKVRTSIEVDSQFSEEEIVELARKAGEKWLNKATIKREVYISGRLVNIVLD